MHDCIRVGNSMVSGGLNSVFKFGSVQWEDFRTICSYPAPALRRSWYGREIFAAILEAIILACVPPGDAFANLLVSRPENIVNRLRLRESPNIVPNSWRTIRQLFAK